MSEFTNHDLGPIVVNNLTNILPLKLFRSITIYLSQNVIVVFWGISQDLPRNQLQEHDSREIPWKFFKESHHGWRIWGNSSLLLLGYN